MNKRPATIRDVAKLCGISHMTVSNVLNRPELVAEETKQRVLQAVKELNYTPNAIARGLIRGQMDTYGTILPPLFESPLTHPYFALVLDGFMIAAIKLEKNVTVYTGATWQDEISVASRLKDGRCDGLLAISPNVNSRILEMIAEYHIPVVVVGCAIDDDRISALFVDDVLGEESITSYLIQLGHRRIAMINGDYNARCVLPRLDGFKNAVKAGGLSMADCPILDSGFDKASIEPAITHILNLPLKSRPTAICCTNDQVAFHVLEILAERGINVPNDISVVGFDDVKDAARSTPSLTTMRQPIREMGERAGYTLARIIEGESTPGHEVFPTELVIRESTAKPGS